MWYSVENCCIVCQLQFCCGECRWKHEQKVHDLQYDCPICRGFNFFCKPDQLNQSFIEHLAEEHLPLQCKKCTQLFTTMEDFVNVDKCTSISEIAQESLPTQELEEQFESIYEKVSNVEIEVTEEAAPANIATKTAIVTPVVRRQHLVDYESSDSEELDQNDKVKTPHLPLAGKTPKLKRSATPHVNKLLRMIKQKAVEYEETIDETKDHESPKTTPSRNENELIPENEQQMTTPTSHLPNLLKLVKSVTTSTPTHPLNSGWSMFPEQGADSPLSEIESLNTDSPAAQSVTNEQESKSESEINSRALKSIIVTGSRIRLGSQDSSEKHVTFQDSCNSDASVKKKVKFAEDTVFEQIPKVKRVYRKPKRMLTPGPQKPRFCQNPRFQALINRFENQGLNVARTPVVNRKVVEENTPGIGDSSKPARAINFKEESPIVDLVNYSKESNDLYKTCVDSPGVNSAITALSSNIAGSIQNCLQSALSATDEQTEIQFKFIITKKKFCTKRITEECLEEKTTEVEGNIGSQKENIWSSVTKAVKNVFFGEKSANLASATPHRSLDSFNSTSSSASKRKCEEMSDSELSPVNHKKHKYEGRIRGRPPLRRTKPCAVAALRSTTSAEHQEIKVDLHCENLNLSF